MEICGGFHEPLESCHFWVLVVLLHLERLIAMAHVESMGTTCSSHLSSMLRGALVVRQHHLTMQMIVFWYGQVQKLWKLWFLIFWSYDFLSTACRLKVGPESGKVGNFWWRSISVFGRTACHAY